jgi:catechol 2,3-dioxygenase-like lactoylglutathione lyase family enzyme
MAQTQTNHISKITYLTLIVEDQDAALEFYTETLGFEKKEDAPMGDDRWLTITPSGPDDTQIVLRPPTWMDGADEERYRTMIGNNLMFAVEVDDCYAAYEDLRERGVEFKEEPMEQDWGVSSIAHDHDGNELLLVEPAES